MFIASTDRQFKSSKPIVFPLQIYAHIIFESEYNFGISNFDIEYFMVEFPLWN